VEECNERAHACAENGVGEMFAIAETLLIWARMDGYEATRWNSDSYENSSASWCRCLQGSDDNCRRRRHQTNRLLRCCPYDWIDPSSTSPSGVWARKLRRFMTGFCVGPVRWGA